MTTEQIDELYDRPVREANAARSPSLLPEGSGDALDLYRIEIKPEVTEWERCMVAIGEIVRSNYGEVVHDQERVEFVVMTCQTAIAIRQYREVAEVRLID